VSGTPTLTTAAPSRATNPEFFLDLNQFGFASPEVKRGNAFLSAEFDFTDTVTAFADFSYYVADSTMRRQPLALNAPTLSLPSTIAIVRRNAMQRGLIGGSKGWLAVFVAISARSFLKKHAGRQMEVVSTEVLTKGQAVSVRSIPPLTRRQRRALRSR
jgi:hypothetical protein